MSAAFFPIVAEFQPCSVQIAYANVYRQPMDMESLKKGNGRALLSEFYTFPDAIGKTEVMQFIRENYSLTEILVEAPKHISRIFGNNVTLHLELHNDPEEHWDELFIVIKSPYAPEEAMELMAQLGEEWFLHVLDKTEGKLCITEEEASCGDDLHMDTL